MKISSFAKLTGLLVVITGGVVGTTFATSLVTKQTTICAKVSLESPVQLKSISIAPYYNNKPLGSDVATSSENGTCTIVSRDWLMGGAQPGTSFFVTGKDKNNRTYLLESRDIAMFRDAEMNEIVRIFLNYHINTNVIPNATLLVGSVKSELYIYDALGFKSVIQKGIYRSDLNAVDALNAMRQIEATKYTQVSDFKGKDNVTREQAAKFFVSAWKATHPKEQIKTTGNVSCTFSDSNKMDPTLIGYVRNACILGLMKGTQGAFNPQNTLTLAEATTVLVRMQYGVQNETYTPWYRAYFDQAYDVDLFDGFAYHPHLSEGTLPISREMIGFLIRRLLQINNIQPITYPTI